MEQGELETMEYINISETAMGDVMNTGEGDAEKLNCRGYVKKLLQVIRHEKIRGQKRIVIKKCFFYIILVNIYIYQLAIVSKIALLCFIIGKGCYMIFLNKLHKRFVYRAIQSSWQ